MSTASTQIKIDPTIQQQADDLFRNLGLDMSIENDILTLTLADTGTHSDIFKR